MKTSQFRLLPLALALQSVFSASIANAASFTVGDGVTDTAGKSITTGETGTVNSTGALSVSGSTQAVTVTGTTGTVTLNNNGLIEQTGTARAIRNNTNGVTFVLNNALGATIKSLGDDVLKVGQANSIFQLTNLGTIWQTGTGTASGQALDLRDITSTGNWIINGSLTNTSALIRADGDDALRPGANTTITNYGSIISNGTVNTKCPDYLTTLCAGKPSAHDAIDIGSKTGVVIENYGLISGPRHAITADTSVLVNNYEGGQIIGRNGSGVGSDGTATVTNYGLISGRYAGAGNVYDHLNNGGTYTDPTQTTVNNGDGDGVDVDGIGIITNYGRIEGLGGGGYDSGGRPNGGDGLALGGGSVTNDAGAVIWGKSNGILVDDGANGTDNTNLVTNKNRGTASATASAVTITNSGEITGDRKVAIGLVGDWNDEIVNNASGVITGGMDTQQVDKLSTDPSQSAGAAIQMGAGNDTLTNYGRIEGKNGLAIDMGTGDDTLKLFGGTVIGTINGGSGTNALETNGSQNFEAGKLVDFQNYTVRGGTTVFNYGLGTVSNVQVDSGATLRVEGGLATIGNLSVNGIFQAMTAQDVRTINVGGNYTQNSSGLLEVAVAGQNSSDKIVVSGTATLDNGATIRPVAHGYVMDGAKYTAISAGSLLASPAGLNVVDDSLLVDYSLSAVGNDLIVSAQRTALAGIAPNGLGSFGAALDALGKSGNGGTNAALLALDNLSTLGEVGVAIKQLAPNTNNSVMRTTQLSGDTLLNTLDNRISGMRSGGKLAGLQRGVAAGDDAGRRMWVEGTGAWGKQQQRSGVSGYSLDSGGVAFGVEVDRSVNDVMGLAVGYAKTRASGNDAVRNDDTHVETLHAGGYWSHTTAGMTHDVSLILGYNDYTTQRNVNFGGFSDRLEGDFHGWNISGRYEAGLPFTLTPSLGARLLGGVRLGYLNTEDYTEDGGAAAQRIKGVNANSFQSVLGAEMTYQLAENAHLQLRGRYLHEFADTPEIKGSLTAGGSSFTLDGVKPDRDALQLGVALRAMTQQGTQVSISYDAEAREKYLVNQLTARVEWAF